MVTKGRELHAIGDANGKAKITELQVVELRELALTGVPRVELARRFGLHEAHVWRIVNGQRRGAGGYNPPEPERHCAVVDEIVALYQSGLSTIEVGKRVGRDGSVVYRHLVAQGVKMRNQVRPVDADEKALILQMFAAGKKWREIAEATGRSSWAINKVRKEASA